MEPQTLHICSNEILLGIVKLDAHLFQVGCHVVFTRIFQARCTSSFITRRITFSHSWTVLENVPLKAGGQVLGVCWNAPFQMGQYISKNIH